MRSRITLAVIMKIAITNIVLFLSSICWSQSPVWLSNLDTVEGKFCNNGAPFTGIAVEKDSLGKLLSIGKFDHGNQLSLSFYSNQEIKEYREYFNDSTNYIKYSIAYSDTIISDSTYKQEKYISYYNEADEIPYVIMSMIGGKLWGKSSVYLKTSQFHVSVEYQNNFRHGLWTTRFDERIDYQGRFVNGKMDGKWVYQTFEGDQATSTYTNGTLIDGHDIRNDIYSIFELKLFEPKEK